MTTIPKVFISYSWTNPEHEDWVINLAQRLTSDGVDVSIDKWELKEGQDKYNFMEKMVKASEISKVLIILDKKYAEKADERTGGVGTETQIISPNIYSDVSQDKFIPIISEKDENGKAYVPTYLEGRIYIDLSVQITYEENYENLLRNIFKRPAYSKPAIGKAPSYLFVETPNNHKTSSMLKGFEYQVTKNPKRINSLTKDFLEEFLLNLKDYSITYTSRDELTFGKEICDNIDLYTPLRDNFIEFMDKVTKNDSEPELDIDIVVKFLENLPSLNYPQDEKSSWGKYDYDNFKFIAHELFLYLIAVGLKNENYNFIEELLYSSYFFKDKFNSSREPQTFEVLYFYLESIKSYYFKTYSKNYTSPMADLIIKRIPSSLKLDDLVDADLLCYYISTLVNPYWFPTTYIYKKEERYELFYKLISLRHFNKVKVLFHVSSPQELKEKLLEIKLKDENSPRMSYPNLFKSVIPISKLIDIEKIGTVK